LIPPPREICIVMLSAIGDAVHVLPVANALKRAWPECRITWIAQPAARTLAEGHAAIDDFVVFRRRRGLDAWLAFHELMGEVKDRHFDLLLGLQVYAKAGLITALVPARTKVGFDRARARDGQWLVTNARIPARGQRHVQDQYLEFLDYLGVNPEPVTWDITFTREERVAQEHFFGTIDRPVCSVVLGTSKVEKNWDVEGYVEVVGALDREHGFQPVLIGGPSSAERRIADEVIARSGAHVVDTLGDDLRRLMWIIDGSALVISPDTGPLHIATALRTPVVSLFGHTNPKRTGPYRFCEDLVVDGYAEYPGEVYPISPARRNGMERVRADEVLSMVRRAVARYAPLETTEEER